MVFGVITNMPGDLHFIRNWETAFIVWILAEKYHWEFAMVICFDIINILCVFGN